MIYQIFSDDEIKFVRDKLSYAKFVDGKNSQSLSNLYDIKQNSETVITKTVAKHIENILLKRTIKVIYAPSKVKTLIYNKYKEGDFYDYHIDSMQSSTDKMLYNYGFTISLSDDYEGGTFVLQTEAGEVGFNIKKGQAVIFPIIYPHKVETVTKGTRECVIGWFESKISYEQSFILKAVQEIANMATQLTRLDPKNNYLKNLVTKSSLVQNYLVTQWGF